MIAGIFNPSAKLNSAKVRIILADPSPDAAMAYRLGVSRAAVADVRAGRTWKHVQPGTPRRRDVATLTLDLAGGRA